MVPTRDTIQAMLRELENGLPLDRAVVGSIFEELGRDVQPTIDLSNYDPDSNSGQAGAADTNYGRFGQLVALEAGTATLTSAGAQTHTYVIDTGGIPAGEVHVYTAFSIFCNAAAAEDWDALIQGFGIGALTVLAGTVRTPAGTTGEVAWLANSGAPSSPAGNDAATFQNPFIMHPGSTLTVRSLTTIATTAISRIQFIRERYLTNIVMDDVSADIGATAT